MHNTPKRPKKKRALRRLFVPIFEESDMETSDNLSEEDEHHRDLGRVRLNPSENHNGREITSILDLVLGSLTSRRERNNETQENNPINESDSENESNGTPNESKNDDEPTPKNESNTIKYESDSPVRNESNETEPPIWRRIDKKNDNEQGTSAEPSKSNESSIQNGKTSESNEAKASNESNVNHELSIVWKDSKSDDKCDKNETDNNQCDSKCDCAIPDKHEIGCAKKETIIRDSKKSMNLVEFLNFDDIKVVNEPTSSNESLDFMRKNKREKFDSGFGDDLANEKWSSDSENANNMEIDSDSESEKINKGNNKKSSLNTFLSI